MNERYAVDPQSPSDWRELKLLLDRVGLQSGRFITLFPSDWSLFLQQGFVNASDMDRKRVTELLRRGKYALSCNASYRRHLSWSENAIAAKAGSPNIFREAVSAKGNVSGLKTLQDLLYEVDKDWPSGVGEHVAMLASDYARCASPLFELSAEITLVDRFFKLRTESGEKDRRRRNVLQAFFNLASANTHFQCLRLVVELPKNAIKTRYENDLERDIGDLLDGSAASHFSVEFDVRENIGHGRYLYSIHGGLHFDHGFDEKPGQKNHVHWLSNDEFLPLIEKYRN